MSFAYVHVNRSFKGYPKCQRMLIDQVCFVIHVTFQMDNSLLCHTISSLNEICSVIDSYLPSLTKCVMRDLIIFTVIPYYIKQPISMHAARYVIITIIS